MVNAETDSASDGSSSAGSADATGSNAPTSSAAVNKALEWMHQLPSMCVVCASVNATNL